MEIKYFITQDKLVGFDEFDQLTCIEREGDRTTMFHISDVRDKICFICNQPWTLTGPGLSDQHHWALIEDFVHESCLVRYTTLVERQEVFTALSVAGIRYRGLRTQEGKYWRKTNPWYRPWYYAELLDFPGRLSIGWRKRVISIELTSDRPLAWWFEAQTAFAGEDVTKEFSDSGILLHAWGITKLRSYLKLLNDLIQAHNKKVADESGQPGGSAED